MISGSTAHDKAMRRMLDSNMQIRDAFDGLDCGFDFDEVIEFMQVSIPRVETHLRNGDTDLMFATVVGLAAGMAIIAVERDREDDRL